MALRLNTTDVISKFARMVLGLALLSACAIAQQEADPLPRRGYFGVGLERHEAGARVFAVTPGSTAAALGIAVGDVITAVDERATTTPEAVVAAMGRHKGGETVRVGFLRNNERRTVETALKAYPSEQMKNATVHYDSVLALPDVRLRTIVSVPTAPSGARFPAVLMIQGGGCGSIDLPFDTANGQPGLIHTIGSQNFVTMRVEKSGVGDSQGASCGSIGFKEELAGYQAALKALLAHPSVDRERIYLVGISLGGVFAPLLAAETKVRGIAVWGTPSAPTSPYPGRSERFFQEFAQFDIASAWARVGTRVLVLHGEYDVDPAVSRASHEGIAVVVNKSAAGSAEFREFAGLDHCWSRHASLEASKDKCGQGEQTTVLADAILGFLK